MSAYGKDTDKWIVVTGNPVEGLGFTGPFDNNEEAMIYAEGEGGDWWIARLEEPVG